MLYKYKGDCLANLGTYEAAFSSYANSVSYNPDFYDAFWQRGYYKYFLGKYDEAIDDYNKAIIIVEATGSSGNKIDLASLYNTKANILNLMRCGLQMLVKVVKEYKYERIIFFDAFLLN